MHIYITRPIPSSGKALLIAHGYEVTANDEDRVLSKAELCAELKKGTYDAMLCLLTDRIDEEVLVAAGPTCKIIANYAVGFDNIDVVAAKKRGVLVSNTPGVLSDAVAEHTIALMMTLARRVVEADSFVRTGKYEAWGAMLMLGTELTKKTLGIIGLGAIGRRVAHIASRGFGMRVCYYDVKPSPDLEKEYGAEFCSSVDAVCENADVITLHVPLLPSTTHLIDERRLRLMKPSALLINTSRGPVIDEVALVEALKEKVITGAALDVFEHEPALSPGLATLSNVVLTPHIASATTEARDAMAETAAANIIAALEGKTPPNLVVV